MRPYSGLNKEEFKKGVKKFLSKVKSDKKKANRIKPISKEISNLPPQ